MSKARNSSLSIGESPAQPGGGAGPVRTCVGCKQEAGKAALIRLLRLPDGMVWTDRTGRAPGRGAYLHPSADCIESARKKRALERALGGFVTPEVWAELGG